MYTENIRNMRHKGAGMVQINTQAIKPVNNKTFKKNTPKEEKNEHFVLEWLTLSSTLFGN